MSTLLELAQRLWRESGRSGVKPDDIGSASGDGLRMLDGIRDEWVDLQLQPRNWRWMRKTASGATTLDDGAYTFGATDVATWVRQSDHYAPTCWLTADATAKWDLEYLPPEQFTHRYLRETVSSGRPYHWSVSATNEMLIGPAPDSALYTIAADYWKTPTELTVAADEPDMPERFHLLLVWLALESVAIGDEAAHQIARAKRHGKRLMSQLIASEGEVPNIDEWGPLA